MQDYLDFMDEGNMSLFTDLYELTMCASYFDNGKMEPATFDLSVRRLPPNRPYLVFTGLEQVLLYLEKIEFSQKHLDYLEHQGFASNFLDYLKEFKFSGEVWAAPEGSVVFPEEPLIRITAPIIEAQLIETFLLNTINLQTMIATKASRVVEEAKGKPVIEFGLRREQGIDAGMKVARSSYIAGCDGTSNVLAGLTYDIPIFGTMAHSFIMYFENEIDAFRAFAKTFPKKSTLLIDTYDDMAGAEKAATVAKELEAKGFKLGGVRLDSGDLVELSNKVRQLLDKKGLQYVNIFASGDLDEYKINELIEKSANIDAFGVGTRMGTSVDYPYIDVIYKLSEKMNINGQFMPIMKLSKGKVTLPGRKQVYRQTDEEGYYSKDIIELANEQPAGDPLLKKVMQNGKIINKLPTLKEIRDARENNILKLPKKHKRLFKPETYPIHLSQALSNLMDNLKSEITEKEIEDGN
jgi:nicotinate phosphoribosyltransferase